MNLNVNIKQILLNSIIISGIGIFGTVNANAECPPRLQARIQALSPQPPTGWENVNWQLPTQATEDETLISISNDLSEIRNSEELKNFREQFRINPLNVDPKIDPKRLYYNALELHSAFVGQAQHACEATGALSQRIQELVVDANQAFEDYQHDEWIDFASNSLSVSGTVKLYATGVGEAVQLGRAALKVKKLKTAKDAAERVVTTAETAMTFERKFYDALRLGDEIPELRRWLNRAEGDLAYAMFDYKLLRDLLFDARRVFNAEALRTSIVGLTVGVKPLLTAANQLRQDEQVQDAMTEVLLGGSVWKQFRGFRNPYEEMININLEMKKKWNARFEQNTSKAQSLKRQIEILMRKIKAMENEPTPSGIGYGGFTITRP
jgi:hypothetical protein